MDQTSYYNPLSVEEAKVEPPVVDDHIANLSERIVFGPDRISSASIDRLKQIETGEYLIQCPIPGLNEQLLPLEGGTITMVNAQSHNGKTMFMDYWARELAKDLTGDDWIVWIDQENFAEEIAVNQMFHHTDFSEKDLLLRRREVDWDEAYRAIGHMVQPNILRITASITDSDAMAQITVSNIRKVLHHAVNGGYNGRKLNIKAIFADYLQAFPFDPEIEKHSRSRGYSSARRLQIAIDFNELFLMARDFDCAMIIGCQARENIRDKSAMNMPTYFEAHESTDPTRRAHNVICLSMPKQHSNPGDMLSFTYRGQEYSFQSRSDIMFVKLGKQRAQGSASGGLWMLSWDYDRYQPMLTTPDARATQPESLEDIFDF